MEYIIDSEYDNVRLDRFIRKKYTDIPLTEIFKGIRTGKIKVNGKKSKENYRLVSGDIIKVFFDDKVANKPSEDMLSITDTEKSRLKKSIIYENESIIIYNKKENEVMHKGSGHDFGLAELFKAYYNSPDFNFVNRIDKSTSGLVIGAKTLVASRELAEDIRNRSIIKKYYILVLGSIVEDSFTIKSYLKKEENKVVELDKYEDGAKESISYFSVKERSKRKTLLVGELGSGRTHQLRVQLSNRNNPIIGDDKYGAGHGKHMFLMSYYIQIPRYDLTIELPLPETFTNELHK